MELEGAPRDARADAEERLAAELQTTPRRSRRMHADDVEDVKDEDADEAGGDEGVTRCVCGSADENVGLMIQCETCKCWQHCACMGMHTEDDCPDVYYCEQCRPENHIELLRSLGFLPSPKAAKRGAGRTPRAAFGTRELKEAKDAIRAMALDNAARLRDAAAERASPAPKRRTSPPRRLAATTEARAPKRRSTMNSREIGENGWESIPAELLAEDDGGREGSDDADDATRKRKRSPREPPADDGATESAADAAKRRRMPEARSTPQPDARRAAPREDASKPRHPNQYTYRNKEAPAPRRDARRTRDAGARPDTPQPEAPAKGGVGALPEHLQHLAYLLPPFVGEGDEGEAAAAPAAPAPAPAPAGALPPLALTLPIDAATKIRYPPKRMTLGEMRKRVRNIGEYVTRVQIEAVERAKRAELLRAVRAETAPATQAVPLSMQLVEQLTSDLTAFQRRFMSGARADDDADAA
ncbi:Histone deacetylase complex subunit [Malassezia obtusa]|uniref:Histone deacetylase complex subunit n=1 Tax=Malassezia obtusa TaxID=76774 RepID=A0AAF0E1D7_9BASI|nr:Histone deacetylase complex subunit [Malassezia obtusa]